MSYSELFKLVLPETIVVITGFVVLLLDLMWWRQRPVKERMTLASVVSGLGCVVSMVRVGSASQSGNFYSGMLVIDPLIQMIQQALLLLTIFTALISRETNFTEHVGEYFLLLLLATVGLMFMVSSENILMIFVSLELTSLSLYIMTAFNKHNLKSAEAALKYFLFGGMSAAFMLFGLSLLYGLSHSLVLKEIAAALKGPGLDPLLVVALVMVVIGFGFKIAAVPFHLWAPDAYQGAPTTSAAFIAAGSKVASFFIFAKVLLLGFAGAEGSGAWRNYLPGWVPVIAVIAAASMLLGNLAAIAQSSVKRLLAYSAIAQAGYVLVGLLAHNQTAVASLIYYVVTYALTVLGAFGVVAIVEASNGFASSHLSPLIPLPVEGRGKDMLIAGDDKLSSFAGLSRRAPLLSFCMMIFMLSLAGIPPLAGFFGKFYLFTAAVGTDSGKLGLLWLVIFAIAMSAVSLYYYLQVLKQIYVADAAPGDPAVQATVSTKIALSVLALGVLVLGCAPNLLLERLQAAIKAAGM
ncbi:MAG TPA: NADH-quinone oxidoreductase subunit N [Candidatus Eisenbacteria bacterium]|nr:NADH-quinone oxidoreductase subunit N [Candidatus Eisenbacteria bacterium]